MGELPARPERTCVGCRRRSPRRELLRIVLDPASDPEGGWTRLIRDASTSMPGRGAWLHPDGECISAAIARRALLRALRLPGGTGDLAEVEELAAEARAGRL